MIALVAIPPVLVLVFFGGEITGWFTGGVDALTTSGGAGTGAPPVSSLPLDEDEADDEDLEVDPGEDDAAKRRFTVQAIQRLWNQCALPFLDEARASGTLHDPAWDGVGAWDRYLLDHYTDSFARDQPPGVTIADGWGEPVDFPVASFLRPANQIIISSGAGGDLGLVKTIVLIGADHVYGTDDDCIWEDSSVQPAPACWTERAGEEEDDRATALAITRQLRSVATAFKTELAVTQPDATWEQGMEAWDAYLLAHWTGAFHDAQPPDITASDGGSGHLAVDFIWDGSYGYDIGIAAPRLSLYSKFRQGADGQWNTADDCDWYDVNQEPEPACWQGTE